MVVGGVGGAVHGSRKNLEKKRKAWAKQVAADKVKAGAVFDVMPWDAAGCLPAAQVPALLAEVMGVGVETLDADGAGLVVNHARKAAGVAEEADALPREALLESVSKYRSRAVWKSTGRAGRRNLISTQVLPRPEGHDRQDVRAIRP